MTVSEMFHFLAAGNKSVTTCRNSLSTYATISSNTISTLRFFQVFIDQYFQNNHSNCFNTQ